MSVPRRFRPRFALVAVGAVAAAALAAGIALAKDRAAPVGTGVVVIETNLAYQGGRAAGTGMVLTSAGEILTNNHVIRGATTIKVVVTSTGRSYTAKVVGYDVSDDVALLQATGASNLKTVSLGNSATLELGQAVKAVGNAGGTGSLATVTGRITGLARAITVSDDQGGSARLTGLIETSAALQAGDSGGPLLSSAGKVIGMDTAASVSSGLGFREAASGDGYAIPINKVTRIVERIESGKSSATVHIGGTAFLGVEVVANDYDGSGAVVAAVVPGSPAHAAGLVPGELVTRFGGHTVTSPAALSALVLAQKPGTRVVIGYVEGSGTSGTTTVTLGSGPPQ